MGFLFELVFVSALTLVTYTVHSIKHNPARRAMEMAAISMGLERDDTDRGRLSFFGKLDAVEVRVSLYVPDWVSRRRIGGPNAPAVSKLSVSAKLENPGIRSAMPASKGSMGGLKTGDLEFDEAVLLEADDSILAALSASTRLLLSRLVTEFGASISGGTLSAGTTDRYVLDNPGEIESLMKDVGSAARALSAPLELRPGRLLDLFRCDPVLVFRLRCLDALLREYPGSEEADRAIHVASADPEPVCRIISASCGSDQEHLRHLIGSLPNSTLAPALDVCSKRICVAVRKACAQLDADDAFPKFRELLRVEHMGWTRDLVAEIASYGTSAMPTLIELLEDANPEIRKVVIRELGASGSSEAVEPLQDLARRRLMFGDEALRKSAEAALRQIRFRLASRAGQLSLAQAHDQAGAVSLAEETGQLSLVDAQRNEGSEPREENGSAKPLLEEPDSS